MLNRITVIGLGALAAAGAALFVGKQRRVERANAVDGRVDVQDWESAPIKGTVPGADVPPPEVVAKEVTGVTPEEKIVSSTGR